MKRVLMKVAPRVAGTLALPTTLAFLGMPAVAAVVLVVIIIVVAICWIISDDDRSGRMTALIFASRGQLETKPSPRPAPARTEARQGELSGPVVGRPGLTGPGYSSSGTPGGSSTS